MEQKKTLGKLTLIFCGRGGVRPRVTRLRKDGDLEDGNAHFVRTPVKWDKIGKKLKARKAIRGGEGGGCSKRETEKITNTIKSFCFHVNDATLIRGREGTSHSKILKSSGGCLLALFKKTGKWREQDGEKPGRVGRWKFLAGEGRWGEAQRKEKKNSEQGNEGGLRGRCWELMKSGCIKRAMVLFLGRGGNKKPCADQSR